MEYSKYIVLSADLPFSDQKQHDIQCDDITIATLMDFHLVRKVVNGKEFLQQKFNVV